MKLRNEARDAQAIFAFAFSASQLSITLVVTSAIIMPPNAGLT
ncbi:MAG TPA: hypothetical protein VGM43_18895 [Bryobacteraceae bacterium]